MPRLAALLLVLALGVVGVGCGEEEPRTEGETEGLYIELDELLYQVQISRVLNPQNAEDEAYLIGLPESTDPPERGEVWFAIFLRVQNVADEPKIPAEVFKIVDSDEREYTPLLLDPELNPFAYESQSIPPGSRLPIPDSIAANGPTQGSLLLFQVDVESLQNRPLEFLIEPTTVDAEGVVSLDV